MSLTGILLGLINIAIVIVILVLVGAIALWILTALGWPPPDIVQKLFLAVVALVALYMLAALLLGIPSIRIIGLHQSPHQVGGTIPPAPSIIAPERRNMLQDYSLAKRMDMLP
jgi:MFS family permease